MTAPASDSHDELESVMLKLADSATVELTAHESAILVHAIDSGRFTVDEPDEDR
jgi:hypothetical protein